MILEIVEELEKLSRKKFLILLFSFMTIIGVVGFIYSIVVGPVKTFGDQWTRVEVRGVRTYHPGDTVHLKVICEDPIKVAICTVELNSSIRGLENVTLYSGGEAWWGSSIVYSPSSHSLDSEEFDVVLPSDLQIEGKTGKVYFTIKVEYVYACKSGEGSFYNAHKTKFITVTLDVEMP